MASSDANTKKPAASTAKVPQSKQKPPTQEQIVSGFNHLRNEQRSLATKAAELEMELNEHNLVIETLRQVDGSRKCYRMVGGILVERQAKDVLPALTTNQEQLGKIIQTLKQQITVKGQEINDYREKHDIRIQRQDDLIAKTSDSQNKQSQGVLVDTKS